VNDKSAILGASATEILVTDIKMSGDHALGKQLASF